MEKPGRSGPHRSRPCAGFAVTQATRQVDASRLSRPAPRRRGFRGSDTAIAAGQILARLGQPLRLVTDPDTRDEAANGVRRQVLAAYRDYPAGDVFTGMPADIRWHRAMLTPAELGTVRYIDYPYWTDFSGGTRLAADGARRLGPWQDQPAGTIYRQIAENARDGRLPPPIILISEPGLANLVVIEGHKRLTGLLLCPRWLPAELEVVLGITASHHDK